MGLMCLDPGKFSQQDENFAMAILAAMTEDKLCAHGRPRNLCVEHEEQWPVTDSYATQEEC